MFQTSRSGSRQFLLSTGVPDERDTPSNVMLELIASANTLTKLKYLIPSKSPVFKTCKIIKRQEKKKASNKGSFIFSHLFTTEYVVSCTHFKSPSHLRKGQGNWFAVEGSYRLCLKLSYFLSFYYLSMRAYITSPLG